MQQVIVPPSPNWYGAHIADWAPDLGLYAYGAQNTVVMLNTKAQSVRTMLAGHSNRVTAVAFAGSAAPGASMAAAATAASSPSSPPQALPPLLVSGAADRSLRLWNLDGMQRLRAVYKRPAEATALAVSSDGATALIGDKAGSLFSWDLSDPTSKPVKLQGCKHGVAVASLAAQPPCSSAGNGGGLVLAGYADGACLLLDWRKDRVVAQLERHAREVQCVRWFAAPDPAAAAAVAAAHDAVAREAVAAAAREAEAAVAVAAAVDGAAAAEGSQDAEQQAPASDRADGGAAAAEQPETSAEQTAAAAAADAEALAPPPPPPHEEAVAVQNPAAAAAAVLQAALQALAAALPAWEVLLSSSADGALQLYTLAPGGLPQRLTTLHLPKPPGGLTTSQTSRLWFSATVVPPPPAQPAAAGSQSAEGQQQHQQVLWLVSTSHGGGLLAWKVPLPSADDAAAAATAAAAEARAAAFGRRGPGLGSQPPAGPPVAFTRLPVSHGRTVFSLHAAATLSVSAEGGDIVGEQAGGEQQPEQLEQRRRLLLQLLTSSMDRSVYLTQLPHPGAAVAAAQTDAPEGSWRRDASAGAAADSAWRKAVVTWRLTGLGGYVYALSLLPAPQQPAQQQQQVEEAGEDAQPPPPPPPEQAVAVAAVEDGGAAEVSPPQQEELPLAPPPQQGEKVPAAPRQPPASQPPHEQPQSEPLLLAIACGDKTVRVLPLPGAAAQAHHRQLMLWQNVPDKVTAVAWQPPLAPPSSADGAMASAAVAGLAFGCNDGSLGVMLPSRERSLLLPVKHKGAVVEMCWVPAPATSAAEPAVQLYSLSADGALLLWGPVPLPLSDLFTSSKPASGAGSSSTSWAAPGGKPAALGSPLDVGAQLAAAAAAGDVPAGAASWLGSLQQQPQQQPALTAFAVQPPGSQASLAAGSETAEGASCHVLAAAVHGGGVAVLLAGSASSAAGGAPSLRLLWASKASANAVSHLCFSSDGWQLATADERGLVAIHPWAAEAGLLPIGHPASESAAAAIQLDSGVAALAWAPGSASTSSSCGGGALGSGDMLAAALLTNNIQLLDFHSGNGRSSGSLVPSALLRGHSAVVRCLRWLPPQPQELPTLHGEQQQAGEAAAGDQQLQQQGQEQQEQPGAAEAPEHEQPAPEQQPQPQPKLFLLSGSEDQSVRLYDIQRQLATWRQRQEAAAAAAAAAEAERLSAALERVKQAALEAAAEAERVAVAAAAGVPDQASQAIEQPAAGEEAPPPPPPPPLSALPDGQPEPAGSAGAVVSAAAPVAQPAVPADSTPQAAPGAAVPAAAASAAPPGSKKKAAASALGNRPVLPSAAIGDADVQRQQEAQQACLQLTRQLVLGESGVPVVAGAAPAGGPMPPSPAAALLLDCAAEPLTASLALKQAADSLGASASSAGSAASRHGIAQRAAAAALFRGDVGAAVQLLLEHDALTADFVSMSAVAGPAAWRAVSLAWAAKLERQLGEPSMAALHLLAVGEVEGAVQVYRRAGLLREAVAIAAARLLPGHPLLLELHTACAAQLRSQGQHEQAAAHQLAAGQWAAGARALCARGSASSAAAAVQVCQRALRSGCSEEEGSRLRQQLAEAERLLAERAAAEGIDVAAAVAAVAPPSPPAVAPSERPTPAAGAAAASGGGSRQPKQRYSAQQLLTMGARAEQQSGATSLKGLPEDLVRGPAAAPAVPTYDPAVLGRSGASRHRYSLQALLEIPERSGVAERGAAQQDGEAAALRERLPAELLWHEEEALP